MTSAINKETGEVLVLDSSGQWNPPTTAVNPQTGEKLFLDGDKWAPMPAAVPKSPERASILPTFESLRGVLSGKSADEVVGEQQGKVQNYTETDYSPAAKTALQGLTAGFADEAAAAGRATGRALKNATTPQTLADVVAGRPSASETYDAKLTGERAQLKDFRERNPGTALGLEIGGGFLSGAPKMAAAAPGYLRNIRDAAIAGGVSGFGSGEGGFENRAGTGALGAGGGATFAGSAPVVAHVFAKAGRYIGDALGLTNADEVATRKLIEAFDRDGISPQDAAARIQEWQTAGAKPEMLFDLGGENVRGLTRAATQVPGAGRNNAIAALTERQAGQGERVAGDIADGVSANNRFYDTADEIAKVRAQDAAPKYEKAFSTPPVHSDRVAEFVQDPIIQQGIKRGLEVQRLEALAAGKPFNPADYAVTGFNAAGDPIIGPVPNMRLLDAAKRGVDDILETYRDKTTGKLVLDQRGRAIDQVRRSFINTLDDLNPDYAAARAAWSGPSQSLDAMAMGRQIFKKDSELTAKGIAGMSESDREFFKAGVVRALKDIADNTADNMDLTKRIANTPGAREKLRAAFDSDGAFEQFLSQLAREKNMFRNAQFVSANTGSQTTPRALDGQDLANDPALQAMGQLLIGNPVGAGGRILSAVAARPEGARPKVADALVRALYESNPDANVQTVNRLLAKKQQQELTSAARAYLAKALTTGVGAGSGLQTN